MSESTQDALALAREEKKAARRMNLSGFRWMLITAVIIWVAYLILPHSGSTRGYEITFLLPSAREGNVQITEFIYAILIGLGLGVFSTLVLITERAVFGLIAWMLSTVGLFYSIFAIWLRQTGPGAAENDGVSIGMLFSVFGVALAVFAYCCVALRRDPEQRTIAEARSRNDNLDEVGRAQRELLDREREQNPLLIDDRRQRAAERHRKNNT